MTPEEFHQYRRWEDKHILADLEQLWLHLQMMKVLEPEDSYWARLELTADECIHALQAKMVRRYMI